MILMREQDRTLSISPFGGSRLPELQSHVLNLCFQSRNVSLLSFVCVFLHLEFWRLEHDSDFGPTYMAALTSRE